jgi:antitoxin component YwqK of YwqJK toxin-antitoxin module
MSPTRAVLNVVVFTSLLAGGGFYYVTHKACSSPIAYKIGTFDTGFGISKEDFLSSISSAGLLWDASVHKTLFAYNPKGSLTVNLVYDNRQKVTQQNQMLEADTQKLASVASSVKAQYQSLEADYQAQKAAYTAAVEAFNKDQTSYSTTVEYWNSQGGAPHTEYEALTSQRNDLIIKQSKLESDRLAINSLVDQINAFIEKYNLLVNDANAQISTINQSAGKEFEEGQFDPRTNSITIYEFSNNKKLVRVLAHELGHAIGLDHNANPLSVMYPVNQATTLILTKDDIAALKAVCKL